MAQTRQETAFSDPSDLVARRMGFIPLPLGVAIGRVLCATVAPSAKPANAILLILAYLILVALRILNSLVILGKACDFISSQPKKSDDAISKGTKVPNLGAAMFSDSTVSLHNVHSNATALKKEGCVGANVNDNPQQS